MNVSFPSICPSASRHSCRSNAVPGAGPSGAVATATAAALCHLPAAGRASACAGASAAQVNSRVCAKKLLATRPRALLRSTLPSVKSHLVGIDSANVPVETRLHGRVPFGAIVFLNSVNPKVLV